MKQKKSASILKKFLIINLTVFSVLGLFTIIYLEAIQPTLVKERSDNHKIVINNTKDNLERLNVKYNKVLILDADLSTDISELKDEWLNLDDSLLIGSRFLGDEIDSPKVRKISGFILNCIIRLFFDIDYRDTQCGFKFIAYENINSLANELSIEGFMYDLDLITLCKKKNLDIQEIPIRYVFNTNSSAGSRRAASAGCSAGRAPARGTAPGRRRRRRRPPPH